MDIPAGFPTTAPDRAATYLPLSVAARRHGVDRLALRSRLLSGEVSGWVSNPGGEKPRYWVHEDLAPFPAGTWPPPIPGQAVPMGGRRELDHAGHLDTISALRASLDAATEALIVQAQAHADFAAAQVKSLRQLQISLRGYDSALSNFTQPDSPAGVGASG